MNRRRATCAGACLAAMIASAAVARGAETEWFILWSVEGRFDGSLQVVNGRLTRVEPYNFETSSDERLLGSDSNSVSWQSGASSQIDGLRLFLDAGAKTTVSLRTPDDSRVLRPADFPEQGERIVSLPGKNRTLILGRGDPAAGPTSPSKMFPLPPLFEPPKPSAPIALPASWWKDKRPVRIRLANAPTGPLAVRRVSRGDGTLYLEIYCPDGTLTGRAEAAWGDAPLGAVEASGAVWLSLEPRIDTLGLEIEHPGPGGKATTTRLESPATLVETRGSRLFVNGEPFLVKGTLGGDPTDEDAAMLKAMGANTLRTREASPRLAQYGFMAIGVIGYGIEKLCEKSMPREKFVTSAKEYAEAIPSRAASWVASPYLLMAQLGNEQVTGGDPWTGRLGACKFGRLDLLLACACNAFKPLCPMTPCSYSNCARGYRTPDFMEVYAHNTYLGESVPVSQYSKWQGCEHRPFVMTEWGANIYTPQAYKLGPNSPVLEKIHAWNYPNRWREYLDAGVSGGTNYCFLDSLKTKRGADGKEEPAGTSNLGVMTYDHKPKLALWELGRLWRDFQVEPADGAAGLRVRFLRDYAARDCVLTLEGAKGTAVVPLDDFAPRSERVVPLPPGAPDSFRWRIDYATHGGLPMAATGAQPPSLEAEDFLDRLKARDTFSFLRELFDAQVVNSAGSADVTTLADLERSDGVVAVGFRKPNGVTYLAAFTHNKPADGWYVDGVTIDTAFHGRATAVDEMTGKPIDRPVEAEDGPRGLRLKDLRLPCVPSRNGARSKEKLSIPVWRIDPRP